jgi:ABC-type transport system involved in multi-copper enzyme maturation permease subunit
MHLFGPVLQYDMMTTARRARYFAMRFFYALLLFLVLYVFYNTKLRGITDERVARQTLIDFVQGFSNVYLIVQYLLVLLLTPAYVGTAIAEEKERRTLEFLMATDLRNHEIILGKCASRLGNVLMFLLAGLPVLSFILFFGGVDPELLKNGFLATFLTAFSVTCVSIYCSTHARHSRDGILRSYLMVIGYFILSVVLWWLVLFLQGVFWGQGVSSKWSLEETDGMTRGICYFTEYFMTGNIFHAIYLYYANVFAPFLGVKSWTGVDLGTTMPELMRNYSIFHGCLAILCLVLSIWRLRRLFVLHAYGEKTVKRKSKLADLTVTSAVTKATKAAQDEGKPTKPVRGRRFGIDPWPPMVWKEWLVPQQSRRTFNSRILTAIAWAIFLIPLAVVFFVHYQYGTFNWSGLKEATNFYARIAGTTCLCLMVLAVGVRAANIVCMERDKQTMETLLSSVLTDHEILFGKWFGCVFGFGPSMVLILIIWITCVLAGGLGIPSILFLVLAYFVYAAFAAALGLFFSAGTTTTTRSLLATLFWMIIWMGAHWMFGGVLLYLTASSETGEIQRFLVGMTPVVVLGFMAEPGSLYNMDRSFANDYVHYFWVGLIVNALLAVTFYFLATHRFYLQTGRIHTLSKD